MVNKENVRLAYLQVGRFFFVSDVSPVVVGVRYRVVITTVPAPETPLPENDSPPAVTALAMKIILVFAAVPAGIV